MSGENPPIPPVSAGDRRDDAAGARLGMRLIDGELSSIDAAALSARLIASREEARELARLLLLHDAIERECTVGAAVRESLRRSRLASLARRGSLVAASILLVSSLAILLLAPARSATAADALARVRQSLDAGDRTYLVRAIDDPRRPRRLEFPPAARDPRRSPLRDAPLDGAIVHLRPPSSYVLVRTDLEGRAVASGSDGASAWLVPAEGPVRVSRDPSRFQGLLPGGRLGVPFVDPRAILAGVGQGSLVASHDLVLHATGGPSSSSLSHLVATRREGARGGPKRIEIQFEPDTSLVRLIRLENLPQAHGGPRSVEFELVDDAPLPEGFFRHEAHHAVDRTVIEES